MFVGLTFRQQVHAVTRPLLEPPVLAAGHPDILGAERHIALGVGGGGAENHIAGYPRGQLTREQSVLAGAALTVCVQPTQFGPIFIGIKTADHAFAIGGGDAVQQFHPQLLAGGRLARQVQGQHLKTQLLAAGGPALGLDTQHDPGRPQGDAPRHGTAFAVGILIFQFGQQFPRPLHRRQTGDGHPGPPRGIEGQGQHLHRAAPLGRGIFLFATVRHHPRTQVAATKAETGITRHGDAARLRLGTQCHRQPAGSAAAEIGDKKIKGRLARPHQKRLDRLHHRLHGGNAELLDVQDPTIGPPGIAALQHHLILAQFGLTGDGPVCFGNAGLIEGQQGFIAVAAAAVTDTHPVRQFTCGNGKTRPGAQADNMFHRHRFTCLQQAPVKNGMRHP